MLPPNIDLTENRNFSGNDHTIYIDLPIDIPMDEYQSMTPEQYEHLLWYESIFGRKRHLTEKRELFQLEWKELNELRKNCYRCGRPLRIPWNNFGGICRKCEEEMGREDEEDSRKDRRKPWKTIRIERVRDTKYELFNSR